MMQATLNNLSLLNAEFFGCHLTGVQLTPFFDMRSLSILTFNPCFPTKKQSSIIYNY